MNPARQYLSLKKLTGRDIVRVAAKHNLREIQAEIGADGHIDHTRIGLNRTIAGAASSAEVAAYAEHLLSEAAIGKLRKDAVRAVEIVVSLPSATTINGDAFFSDTLAWVRQFFHVPVLSAVVHLDESAPHCHILLLPLVNGRMAGSDLVGNRKRLQDMQADFFEQVARAYGLVRPKPKQRFNSAARRKAASLALTAIQSSPELLNEKAVEDALVQLIEHDPEPLLTALNLSLRPSSKSRRSFVGIMTKSCKPEKSIGFDGMSNPIGFVGSDP